MLIGWLSACCLCQWKVMNALRIKCLYERNGVWFMTYEMLQRFPLQCVYHSTELYKNCSFQLKHPLLVNTLQGVHRVKLKTINIPNLACTAEAISTKLVYYNNFKVLHETWHFNLKKVKNYCYFIYKTILKSFILLYIKAHKNQTINI